MSEFDPNEYRRDDTRREQEDLRETQGEDYTPAEMAERRAEQQRQLRRQVPAVPVILTGAGIERFLTGGKS